MQAHEAALVRSKAAKTLVEPLRMPPSGMMGMMGWQQQISQSLFAVTSKMETREAAHILIEAMRRETDASAWQSLVESLVKVADKMEANEAQRVCGEVSKILSETIDRETNAESRESLAEGLSAVADKMEANEAHRVCGEVSKILSEAINRETDANSRCSLAESLAVVADKMEANEAHRVCGEVSKILSEAINRKTDANSRQSLVQGLSQVAARMEPREESKTLVEAMDRETDDVAQQSLAEGLSKIAAKMETQEAEQIRGKAAKMLIEILGADMRTGRSRPISQSLSVVVAKMETREAADTLVEAMGRKTSAYELQSLAEILSHQVVVKLEPGEAERVSGKAAKILVNAIDLEKNSSVHWGQLARILSAVATKMEIREAEKVCGEAAKKLAEAVKGITDTSTRQSLAEGLVALGARMDAHEADLAICRAITSVLSLGRIESSEEGRADRAKTVTTLLASLDRKRANSIGRNLAFWAVENENGAWPFGPALFPSTLIDSNREARAEFQQRLNEAWDWGDPLLVESILAEPYPCRLSTQDLVELLKMPTVFGEARQVVLKHLGNRYGRTFANHWQFVRYAKEHHLNLDFTTPPHRPERKGLADRILKILDAPDVS